MKSKSPGHPAIHPLAEALDLGNTVLQLESLTVERLAAVPTGAIAKLTDLLGGVAVRINAAQAVVGQILVTRYGEQAKTQLLADERDTGTTHILDGDIDVTVEIGKDVKWEQATLKQLARRIAEGGEDPGEYIEVKYGVSERKYSAWPDTIRHVFESARTVTPKSPKVTLRRRAGGAA